MKNVFVYRLNQLTSEHSEEYSGNLRIKRWEPELTRIIPPNSPSSYVYFWMMHYFKRFKNSEYCAFAIYNSQDVPISSLVCVPSLNSRWPFMKAKDLQIKNVYTLKNYRGRGYAFRLIQHAIKEKGVKERSYWYMTDEENVPSQKLCKKIGFEYQGRYRRKRNKLLVPEGEIY